MTCSPERLVRLVHAVVVPSASSRMLSTRTPPLEAGRHPGSSGLSDDYDRPTSRHGGKAVREPAAHRRSCVLASNLEGVGRSALGRHAGAERIIREDALAESRGPEIWTTGCRLDSRRRQ